MQKHRGSRGPHVTILGGGLGGLGVGYYASKMGLPITLYEASGRVGGNCITHKDGNFLFDSGAHRFHDRDSEITKEIQRLLGSDLKEVDIPSKIYDHGELVNFPLAPFDIARNLGFFTLSKAGFEILRGKLRGPKEAKSFESYAVNTYGRTIAERFLLNYSEKLWGQPCAKLSPVIAGKRLQGLNLRSLLRNSVSPGRAGAGHLEGMFYYPKFGINSISEKLAGVCGWSNICTDSTVTGIAHNKAMIEAIEINGEKWVRAEEVVSTLPLGNFLRAMKPAAPKRLLRLSEELRYRSLVLVSLFLDTESVTQAATVYFPDRSFPFTRLYEPKNRCIHMSPASQTSLVAEIPCQKSDEIWNLGDAELIDMVGSRLIDIGWISEAEIMSASVKRLDYAYPVLTVGVEGAVKEILEYLSRFSNLRTSGRNGRFVYSWIHDMLRFGKEIVQEYTSFKPDVANGTNIISTGYRPAGSRDYEREQKVPL
ncbi:MAG: FAD-dependent oxidoreductase [Sedimentisphaerales bacterium]|nr:FAD-dependent oxidoreductase [Sedimentisphaerales bacterium]